MKGVKQTTRLTILVMLTLCLALSAAAVWASSGQVSQGTEQAAAATHEGAAQTATVTHEGAAGGHEAAAAAGEHEAAAGGHGAAHGGSLSAAKLKDLGWRVANFIVLMFILVKFAAKPIGAGLAARRKQVKDEIEDLEARRIAAEKSYRDFEAKLATVEKDIDAIVDRAIAQAEIEKVKIIEKAEQAAADIKRQAELAIQKEIMEAKRTLKNEVADKAAAMAEALIVKNLTAMDQVKIVEDYLAKVGAVQ
jgi:F-type H+-transporting ATPase subunit b